MRLVFLGLMMALVGCQHTHLRHNTVHQAKTLSEIYEQQVLDNLAKTVHDAHALPFFAYPKDGSTNISQQANIAATPFNNFANVFGINGSRTGFEQWGLTPVSDPAKLQLMQCAYQRAVYGHPMSDCPECCEKEKAFEGKPDLKLHVYDTVAKTALINPKTCNAYDVKEIGSDRHYYDGKGNSYLVDDSGFVSIPQYDCEGPCAVNCGWLCYGKRTDLPRGWCSLKGVYCDTCVWVPHHKREHLTRLTLKILDYAVNDPPVALKREKEVKLNVDAFGQMTSDESKSVGTVKAIIAIDDPISSILVVDKCSKDSVTKENVSERMKAYGFTEKSIDAILPQGNDEASIQKMEGLLRSNAITKSIWAELKSEAASSNAAEPSPYIIPKRPTVNPGDSYLNPFQLQRDLRALGSQP